MKAQHVTASPLRVDNCARCGAIHWADCVCELPRTMPSPALQELERARDERLTRAERAR